MSVEEDNGKINIKEKKKKFHMIENDEQELEQKIRKHRMRNLRKTLIILGILCAILFLFRLDRRQSLKLFKSPFTSFLYVRHVNEIMQL